MPINRKHKNVLLGKHRTILNILPKIMHVCHVIEVCIVTFFVQPTENVSNRLDMFFLVQRFCNVGSCLSTIFSNVFNTHGDAQSNLPWIPSDHTGTDNLLPFVYIVCLYIRRKEIQPCFFQFFNFIDLSFKIVKKPFMTTSDTH